MKLFKKMRKGFTLIELVVVIAVIAILSAVAVVSYVSITNRAKQSSDEQAVRQMNTALKASGILGAKDITELFDVLAEEGMDAKNYKPLSKNTYFFWDQENNEIVYAKYENGEYVGIYPESYKGKTASDLGHHWFSLSKEIQKVNVDVQTNGEYSVSNAEQLYTILTEEEHHPTSITLSGNVDLMGADISLKGVENFDGGGHEIANLSQLQHESFDNSQNENANSGLLGEIKDQTVTISNVTFDNVVIGSGTTKFCGVLGGAVRNSTVTVSSVSIKNSTVYSLQKGGMLFGYVTSNSKVIIEDTNTISGCNVYTQYGEAGKLIGCVDNGATLVNKLASYDVTLNSLPADKVVDITAATGDTITKEGSTAKDINSGKLICTKSDNKNTSTFDAFRYFNKDSIFTIAAGSNAKYSTTTVEAAVKYTASGARVAISVEGYPNAKTIGALPVIPSML